MSLPADVARCTGSGSDAEGWREGCEHCQRRTTPPADGLFGQVWISAPKILAFFCPYEIPGEEQ